MDAHIYSNIHEMTYQTRLGRKPKTNYWENSGKNLV